MIKNISRHITGVLPIALLASCLASCNDKLGDYMSDPNALHIEVVEAGDSISTRATYSGFHTDFTTGDEIGVYAFDGTRYVSSNVKFTKQEDGSWLPASKVVYSPNYTYYAYYPYIESPYTPSTDSGDEDTKFANFITDDENKFFREDQRFRGDFTASNLMISKGVLNSGYTVKFTMKHKRGLAIINFNVNNEWYYSTDENTKYTCTPAFDTYVPFYLDGKYYYLVKPNTATPIAGQSMTIQAGKYKNSDVLELTGTPTLTYSVSTDQGDNWGYYSTTSPKWLKVSTVTDNSNPVNFSATPTASKTTTIDVGHCTKRDVEDDAQLKSTSWHTDPANRNNFSDLSLGNIFNDDDKSGNDFTTANCYIVNNVGRYGIPLVYGNAIKNGKINTSAFHTNTVNDNVLQDLVGHNDKPIYTSDDIIDAWIRNHGIIIDGAKLIWEDAKGLISDIGLSNDRNYLLFTINNDNIAEGNAVIAATDDGTVVWSWHIWVTRRTFYPYNLTSIATGSHTYDVSPVNLGQIDGTIKVGTTYAGSLCKVRATGTNGIAVEFQVTQPDYEDFTDAKTYLNPSPYYQWGRKDPEPSCIGAYTMDGSDFILETSTESATIGTTIQNPGVHYNNISNYSPYNDNKYNYWDMNQTGTGNITTATVKTIYDPCPKGFCIPTGGLYYYMGQYTTNTSYSTWDDSNLGRTWVYNGANLFFPALGQRLYFDGDLNTVGTSGCYWSASAYAEYKNGNFNKYYGYMLNIGSDQMIGNREFRTSGQTVRPVLEE